MCPNECIQRRNSGPITQKNMVKDIPYSNKNPQGVDSIQNMYIFTVAPMIGSNEMGPKQMAESLSSGFGSAQDILESEYEMFNLISRQTNNSMNITTQNGLLISSSVNHLINSDRVRTCMSPSNLLCLNNMQDTSNEEKIIEDEFLDPKNNFSSFWDLEKDTPKPTKLDYNSNFNGPDNWFNIEDVLNTQDFCNNTVESNSSINQFDLNQIGMNRRNNFEKNNSLETTSALFTESLEQTIEQINYNCGENFTEMHLITNQNYTHNPMQQTQLISNDACKLIFFLIYLVNNQAQRLCETNIPSLTPLMSNLNISGMNNPLGQNVLVRILQNGQMQYAAIDQNLLQQIVVNNTRQNCNFLPNINDLNVQLARTNLNGNATVEYNNDSRTDANVKKINDHVDLMENPANWRRIPNNGGYQCNICNKCYTRKYGLKIHLRIHSGFKPLECKVCKKKFGDPSNMAKHIRLHSSEGSPYKCALCNKPL
ncbi:hypothetical protein HZS_5008, partial [Henneguya salminicola]